MKRTEPNDDDVIDIDEPFRVADVGLELKIRVRADRTRAWWLLASTGLILSRVEVGEA